MFSAAAGIARNGSSITANNSYAPDGVQVAYLTGSGSMSQTVYLDAETYNLSFLAAQCANGQSQNQQIQVLFDPGQADAQVIGLITPSVTTANSTTSNANHAYSLYETLNFTVAAGIHTIEFLGMSSKSTALIDDVSIVADENTLSDGSFETPALAAKNYAVTPSGSAWQFSGESGLATDLAP